MQRESFLLPDVFQSEKKTQQQTKKTKKQDISGSGIMREIYLHDEKCLQMR